MDPAPTEPITINIFRDQIPHPTQLSFLQSQAPYKDFQGAFGSGKTQCLAWQVIILAHSFPNNRGLIGRYAYPDLRDTTRKRFMEVVDPALVRRASLPETGDGYVEWKVGGVTLFRNLDRAEKFGSLSLGYFGIDEGSECPESVWDYLEARVGRHWKDIMPSGSAVPYSPGFMVGNPGGRDWRWKKFHSTGHDGNLYAGFVSRPRENEAFLPPGYYDRISRGKPAWWIARYVMGKIGAQGGLVWPMWDDDMHLVATFVIPRDWRRQTGHDHGRNNPTACLWSAVDTAGNLVCFREYENAGPTIAEHCNTILRAERKGFDQVERRIADPSMFNKIMSFDRGGKAGQAWWSVADEYREHGLELEPGDNAMNASLERVALLLWPDPSHPFPDWHPRRGQLGSPRVFFFNTLERTAECVSKWKFKEFAHEVYGLKEEPVEKDDHLPDCLRYTALSFPEPTVQDEPAKEPTRAEWRIERQKAIGREVRRIHHEDREREERSEDGWD